MSTIITIILSDEYDELDLATIEKAAQKVAELSFGEAHVIVNRPPQGMTTGLPIPAKP